MAKLIYRGYKNEIYIPSLNIRSLSPGIPFEVPDGAVEGLLKNEGFEKFDEAAEKVSNDEGAEESATLLKEELKPGKKSKAKDSKVEKGE